MSGASLELLNFPEFLLRADAALEVLKVEAGLRLKEAGDEAARTAASLAPIGSGDEDTPGELRDSIAAKQVDDTTVEVGSFGVPYAVNVEFGTSKMPAEPFLRPALASAKIK
jgi:HK97 gp10 family phage protein